jgi:hypothetical protein
MKNLSIAKRAQVYSLINWYGHTMDSAIEFVSDKPFDVVDQQTGALGSIKSAKLGIEKHLLNGQEIKMEYLTGEEEAPEGYFENLSSQIFENMSHEQIMSAIMTILKEIHNDWASDPKNIAKYNRDANDNDKRLFQHLPFQMIGVEEFAKDLMFLAPILEVLGINVGEMQKGAWGKFIPSEEVANYYEMCSEVFFKTKGITSENLAEKLPEIIESYPPLQDKSEVGLARKQYMLERVDLLAKQVDQCLGLENPVA